MLSSKELDTLKKVLCPPGEGVYTVHTAQDKKNALCEKLFQTIVKEEILKKWFTPFAQLENQICLLGITSDCGGGIQRGANWGPLYIREALYKTKRENLFDLGDIRTIPHLLHDKYLNPKTLDSCRKALYNNQDEDLPVSPLSITEVVGKILFRKNTKMIALGGDHSVSYPLVKSWIETRGHQEIAIIHFDAHTDLMNKRLGIDLCFGSWAYHILPGLKHPQNLLQLGIRSSGQEKSHWEDNLGVKQLWANEILSTPLDIVIQTILDHLNSIKPKEVYLSFDIDALDIKFASATGTPELGGLELHHCTSIISAIGQAFNITAADIVEVAPHVVSPDSNAKEPETTIQSAEIIFNSIYDVMDQK